jgi:putative transposase
MYRIPALIGMPRLPRINLAGLTYHVMNRGVKKLAIFHDAQDRQRFLQLLLIAQTQYPFIIQAYSLMTNHFHLLMKTMTASLSEIMQVVSGRYALWFNRKYDHIGHAFQARFHSIPVQTDAYLAQVSRYIDLNAPRAGLIIKPEDYAWCGYRSLVQKIHDPVIDQSEVLALFSEDRERASVLYQRFVQEDLDKPGFITHEKLLKMRSWGKMPDILIGPKVR